MTENIEYIDDAVNGIECIGDGKFTVTEERLRELLENEVIKNLYDMNVDAPDIVADTLIGIIIDNHNEAKESSDA